MITVKVMRDGNREFFDSISTISNKFELLLEAKKEIDSMLSSEKWAGKSKKKCEDMHKLTETYRIHLSLQYLELEKITTNLKNNINDFASNFVANEL